MTRGRGQNAIDRSGDMTASGIEIDHVQPMTCPEHLPGYASLLWDHLASQTFALRLLRPEDAMLLESLCMQYQMFRDAQEAYAEKNRDQRLREPASEDSYKRNTEIDIMTKASDQMIKLSKMLGIGPLVRAQMNLSQAASTALMATAFPEKVKQLYEAANGKNH